MKRKSLKGLTYSEYAAHRKKLGLSGGSKQAVGTAVQSRRISRNDDGSIDAEKADRDWLSHTDQTRLPAPKRERKAPSSKKPVSADLHERESGADEPEVVPEGDPNDYWKSKAAREFWESKISRLKAEKEAGTLIDARRASEAWGGMIVAVRTGLLALPCQMAARLAAESDPIEVEEILKVAVRRLLGELKQYRAECPEKK